MKLTKNSGIMKFDLNSKRVSADPRKGTIKFEMVFLIRMIKMKKDSSGYLRAIKNQKLICIYLKMMQYSKKFREQMEVFLIRLNLYVIF